MLHCLPDDTSLHFPDQTAYILVFYVYIMIFCDVIQQIERDVKSAVNPIMIHLVLHYAH